MLDGEPYILLATSPGSSGCSSNQSAFPFASGTPDPCSASFAPAGRRQRSFLMRAAPVIQWLAGYTFSLYLFHRPLQHLAGQRANADQRES